MQGWWLSGKWINSILEIILISKYWWGSKYTPSFCTRRTFLKVRALKIYELCYHYFIPTGRFSGIFQAFEISGRLTARGQPMQASLGRIYEKLGKRINSFNLLYNYLVNHYCEQALKHKESDFYSLHLGLGRMEGRFNVSSSESLAGCKCWDLLID